MPKILYSLPLIAALALGQTAAFAQDTSTTETATDTASETPATEPKPETMADGLSMGDEPQPSIPQPYVKEEFDDWKLQCFPVEEGDEPCQLYQLLKDEQGTDVAEVAMFRLPSGGQAVAGATITVPLETLLTAQLTVAVDGGKGKRYPFSFCSPVGCYARIGFTSADIAAFKKGAKATVTLVPAPAPDQKVVLNMSLKGFTAGYNAATVINN
ncbi:invasion associated locus B family protein [Rhodalgimonas zhirmunskyi]|uniref:Invasion associated locus B family protein n=1 Tax=Rhodalgimonas zhirmunskyi TaxID=2964767 RepID=A0AAJ1U7J5_9RHOB|nr:invasion associated locus B family protein [Rhodoalgimonas zhirmunskyi]MDQ2092763.1 invasion associated locus B family protein [Rhodoalgimonas zhirmunskyi]